MMIRVLLTTSMALASTWASAKQALKIQDAWMRQPPPPGKVTAAFMNMRNSGTTPITVSSVESNCARAVEIHATTKSPNGMMGMTRLDELKIAPGETVELKPGSTHIMFFDVDTKGKKACSVKLLGAKKEDVVAVLDVPLKTMETK
jgi:periplasmic copper chaperone A